MRATRQINLQIKITIIMKYGLVENMDMSNAYEQFLWFKAFMVQGFYRVFITLFIRMFQKHINNS